MNNSIVGSQVVGDKENGAYGVYSLKSLCYVDMFSPVKHSLVPRYHTRGGTYIQTRTYEATKKALGGPEYIQLDSGLLVAIGEITEIEETPFALIAHFGDGVDPVRIADNKKKLDVIRRLIEKA